jgi:phosphate transport system permease protein
MERNARLTALAAGTSLVVIVFLILAFVTFEALPLLVRTNLAKFIFGTEWLPVSTPPSFQILPFIVASLLITTTTMVIATPVGMAAAVYIAEMAPRSWRMKAKTLFELLAGIPSVIYGLVGLLVLSPLVRESLKLDSGLSGFTASLLLAVMVLPTVVSLSDDAISAVPRDYRDASLALGATQWQTLVGVTIPAAASGIKGALLLAFGRALGETMLVLMVAGGRVAVPKSIFDPMRTLTATLAAEVNNTAFGGEHYRALFGIGFVLLVATLWLSTAAENYARRRR